MNRVLSAMALVLPTCGGLISQPEGYIDNAGVFRKPNGDLAFVPGNKCVGYDPKLFLTPGPAQCGGDGVCEDLARKRVPQGYPVEAKCAAGATWSECATRVHTGFNDNLRINCTPGPTGDAFCREWFGQFFNGPGRVDVSCSAGCADPVSNPPPCSAADCAGWSVPDSGFGPEGCRCWKIPCSHAYAACALSSECYGRPSCNMYPGPSTPGPLAMCVFRNEGQPSECEQPCKPFP